MNYQPDIVPKWVRLSLGIFAILLIFIGILNYIRPGLLYAAATIVSFGHWEQTGLDLSSPALVMVSYLFAARDLSIGIALLIVSRKGVPESITIVTIICALIAVQTFIVGIMRGNFVPVFVIAPVLLAFEIYVIKTMIGIITRRNSTQP